MRIAALVAAFSLALSALALAAQDQQRPAASSGPEAEILRLDREYHEARFRNDAAGVNRLLAPDYYAVTTNGEHREAGNLSVVLCPGRHGRSSVSANIEFASTVIRQSPRIEDKS